MGVLDARTPLRDWSSVGKVWSREVCRVLGKGKRVMLAKSANIEEGGWIQARSAKIRRRGCGGDSRAQAVTHRLDLQYCEGGDSI